MFNFFKKKLSGNDENSDKVLEDTSRLNIAEYKDRDKILQMQYVESANDIVQCKYCEILYNKNNEIIGAIIDDGTCYKLLSPECYAIAKEYGYITCPENYSTTIEVYLAEIIADKNDSDSYKELNLTDDYRDDFIRSMSRYLVWKHSDTECKTVYNIWIKMKNKTNSMFIGHSTALKLILNGILVKSELKYFINIGLAIDEKIIGFNYQVPKTKNSTTDLLRLIDIINKLPNKQTSSVKRFIDEMGCLFKSIGPSYLTNLGEYRITAKYIGLDGDTIGYRLKSTHNICHSDIAKNNLIELMHGRKVKTCDNEEELSKIYVTNAELKDNNIVTNDDTVKELEVYIRCNAVYVDDACKYEMYNEETIESGLNKKQLKCRCVLDNQESGALYKIEFKDILGESKEILCNDSEVHSIIQSINIDGLSINDYGTVTINAEKLNYDNFKQAERAFENRDYAVLSDLLVHTVLMQRINWGR